jgi:rare lipoprotein A (peptidoglycan hydrolase)
LTDQPQLDIGTDLYRPRASDRARERAGRAAWYGDRAGLLIATSTAETLMSMRTNPEPPPPRRD